MSRRRNIKLLLAYDGRRYSGWQRQKNAPTIQQAIEEKLAVITGQPVNLQGVGRTDAGVHALGMTANFHTDSTIQPSGLLKGLNSMLPRDIRVLGCEDAPLQFHSRFDAIGKTYRYDFFCGTIQLPTERYYRVHEPKVTRIKEMKRCLELIVGTHDFSSFEGTGSRDLARAQGRGAVRTILQASCVQPEPHLKPDHYSFVFQGDGFLRHMVRNLAGTLFEAGKGKISADDFAAILRAGDRSLAGPTAPAHGLFLVTAHYKPSPF